MYIENENENENEETTEVDDESTINEYYIINAEGEYEDDCFSDTFSDTEENDTEMVS
jgi:hypothetical protein